MLASHQRRQAQFVKPPGIIEKHGNLCFIRLLFFCVGLSVGFYFFFQQRTFQLNKYPNANFFTFSVCWFCLFRVYKIHMVQINF